MHKNANEFAVALQQSLIPQGAVIPDSLIPAIVEKFNQFAPTVPNRAERLTCDEIDAFRNYVRATVSPVANVAIAQS